MLPGTSGDALIYATDCAGVCIVSYSTGTLVGKLSTGGIGVCSDRNGNVFVTDDTEVKEYPHGGTTQIGTLNLPGNTAAGCAVDPKSGDLAVVFIGQDDDVAVFPNAQGTPTLYQSHIQPDNCGYDNAGNLFVDGYNGGQAGLSELPSGDSQFTKLSINYMVGQPGKVEWDGKYITYEGRSPGQLSVSRLAISGSAATVVGTTRFKGPKRAFMSWLYKGSFIAPYYNRGGPRANLIGIWRYPKGGKIEQSIRNLGKHREIDIQDVTISVGSARR
jgi:hypothetical protein